MAIESYTEEVEEEQSPPDQRFGTLGNRASDLDYLHRGLRRLTGWRILVVEVVARLASTS